MMQLEGIKMIVFFSSDRKLSEVSDGIRFLGVFHLIKKLEVALYGNLQFLLCQYTT